MQIERQAKRISDIEWNLFLRGAGSLDRTEQTPNPDPESIPALLWDVICSAESRVKYSVPSDKSPSEKGGEEDRDGLPTSEFSDPDPFRGLCNSITNDFGDSGEWKQWIRSTNQITQPLPKVLKGTTTGPNLFQRLILVKALCEEKLQQCIGYFVGKKNP
jgi:hypothetical protein